MHDVRHIQIPHSVELRLVEDSFLDERGYFAAEFEVSKTIILETPFEDVRCDFIGIAYEKTSHKCSLRFLDERCESVYDVNMTAEIAKFFTHAYEKLERVARGDA